MPWNQAYRLAGQLVEELRPVVRRLKVAGSLRRRRPDVGDIEIVVEPEMYAADLFQRMAPDVNRILFTARTWGRVEKSGERQIKVADVKGVVGFSCELYLVHPPAQWGSILAIRTGPWELGKIAMGRMIARGLKHKNGFVHDSTSRAVLPTPTEADFFAAAGLEMVPPAQRDAQAAALLAELEAQQQQRKEQKQAVGVRIKGMG